MRPRFPYVFDTVAARYGEKLTEADEAVARAANAYWVNFGKTGNPNGTGLPAVAGLLPGHRRADEFH